MCPGGWIADDPERNEHEIQTMIEVAQANTNVVRAIVGNEAILRNDIAVEEMIVYLDRVRKALWVR